MILRCTAKLLAQMGAPKSGLTSVDAAPDDWYANLVWLDGRKCLLATHAGTLFSVFVPDVRVAQLRAPAANLIPAIHGALNDEGLPPDALGILDPTDVRLAKTVDRRVLGSMNDLAVVCGVTVDAEGGLARTDLAALHHRLHRNLNGARGYAYAIELAREWAQRADVSAREPAAEVDGAARAVGQD